MTHTKADGAGDGQDRGLTWSMLLAKWADFAQSAVALPDDGDAGRVKRCVPALISLQAVTSALGEVHRLPADERAAGIARADVAIRAAAAQVHEAWKGEALHPVVDEMIRDAQAALKAARSAGVEWTVTAPELIADHPADLVAALLEAGFAGDLYVPSPGVVVYRTCPCAFALMAGGGEVPREVQRAVGEFLGAGDVRAARRGAMRQAYRQFDFGKGGAVRDVVVGFDSELIAGQPLLVAAILGGEAQSVSLPAPKGYEPDKPLPVEFRDAE